MDTAVESNNTPHRVAFDKEKHDSQSIESAMYLYVQIVRLCLEEATRQGPDM